MSVWSALAAAGIGIALVFIGAGAPLWEVQFNSPGGRESWSYQLFVARHKVINTTTSQTDLLQDYSYAELASTQPNMAAVVLKFQLYVTLGLVAAVLGMGLSAATRWKRLPGVFAGVALAGASASIIYAAFEILFAIPEAAALDINPSIVQLSGRMSDGSLAWGPAMGMFLPFGSALAFAWASSDVWHLRPAKKSLPMRIEVVSKPAPAANQVDLPPPPVEPAPVVVREPVIEEVFVIGSNGLLIKHMSRTLMTDKDRDVVGSMISAISSFVREAFSERDGEVHEVSLGDHRFVMCNEKGLVAAILVTAGETEEIVPRLRHLLALLIDRYGDRLMGWQGEALEGIEDELRVLWEPFHLPPPPAE
jgi:hypothetical protein